jgi:hypothetical protein
MFAGAAILVAAEGWAAETPNPTAAVEIVRIGQPVPLAPAPSSAGAAATISSPAAVAAPTRPPATEFIRYYPHWTVEVAGR